MENHLGGGAGLVKGVAREPMNDQLSANPTPVCKPRSGGVSNLL